MEEWKQTLHLRKQHFHVPQLSSFLWQTRWATTIFKSSPKNIFVELDLGAHNAVTCHFYGQRPLKYKAHLDHEIAIRDAQLILQTRIFHQQRPKKADEVYRAFFYGVSDFCTTSLLGLFWSHFGPGTQPICIQTICSLL